MPAGEPPKGVQPRPQYFLLPAGSFLWRVTKRPAAAAGDTGQSPFRQFPTQADTYDPRWGGRFGPASDCPYPYCYAAFDDLTALCEVLLRDVAFDAPQRYLPIHQVAGRWLGMLEMTAPLWLVSLLDAADLAAACQDSWLVHTEAPNYRITQRWAHWLRDSPGPDGKGPAGIVWPSKRQPSGRAVLLFGDRCQGAVIRSPFGERRLSDAAGMTWLDLRLSLLRTQLAPALPQTAGATGA